VSQQREFSCGSATVSARIEITSSDRIDRAEIEMVRDYLDFLAKNWNCANQNEPEG
jgi:predicted double-glycine peptidase